MQQIRFFLITILLFNAASLFSQSSKTISEIENLLKSSPGLENYRYCYGGDIHTVLNFHMDTTQGKLTRFQYTSEGADTIRTDYFFIDNYLVKAHTFKIKNKGTYPIAIYYFRSNKLIYKKGKNTRQIGKGAFKRIAPKFFDDQLKFIYTQYEYLNPSKTRFNGNVPKLLELARREVDKGNQYY